MSFATLMVHVGLYEPGETRVRLAVDLANRFSSRLIGISACAPPPPVPLDAGIVADQRFAEQAGDMKARLEKRGAGFRTSAVDGRHGVEWRFDVGFPDSFVANEARAADLVIIGRASPGGIYQSLDPGHMILQSGRPVLVAPPDVERVRAEHVVIGWKDTREARRAVRDSIPFLHAAKHVTIVEVCPERAEQTARTHLDDVAQYLSLHRATVRSRIAAHPDESATDELLRVAKDENADLIVVGGYGHSRLGEWMFGGVTRTLLASCPVCCLFSH
jgi:nucleotide-binding universal stress UspA family protein